MYCIYCYLGYCCLTLAVSEVTLLCGSINFILYVVMLCFMTRCVIKWSICTPQFVSSQAAVAVEPVPKKDEASEDAEDLVRGVVVLKLPHLTILLFSFSFPFLLACYDVTCTADFRIHIFTQ